MIERCKGRDALTSFDQKKASSDYAVGAMSPNSVLTSGVVWRKRGGMAMVGKVSFHEEQQLHRAGRSKR